MRFTIHAILSLAVHNVLHIGLERRGSLSKTALGSTGPWDIQACLSLAGNRRGHGL